MFEDVVMKIELKNTKLLFLYRSFWFKNVSFDTKDKNLKTIVKALNIKKKKDRIEYVYDEAIKFINKYYSDDLCKFENNQCIVQRNAGVDRINGCCRTCKLLGDMGCISVNLACKLIYCKTALGNLKELKISNIPILKCLSLSQRIILKGAFFNTKEEILEELNYGMLYSGFRYIKCELARDIEKFKGLFIKNN